MAFPIAVRYFINFRNSDTGLTPTFVFFQRADTFGVTSPAAPVGGIVEKSNGRYYFDWTWTSASDPDIVFQVDGGASIPTEEVRYVPGYISAKATMVDEPTSQVKDDVWNDATNRALGSKGDFVEHIGIDTDAVDAATVFGKVYKARDAVMGGTGFGGTGVDVKTTYDRVGAPLGGFTNIAAQLGDPSGANSIAQDIAAIQTKLGTPTAADVSTDITNLRGAGWVATDNLHEIKVAVDAINVETDPAAIANAVWNEVLTSHNVADSSADIVKRAFKILKNRTKISTATNTLTIYNADGVTPLYTFDLKDATGAPNGTSPFERLPLP